MLKTRIGTMIVNIGIITDVIELILLGIILSYFNISSSHPDLLWFFASALAFIGFVFFAGRFIVLPIFEFFERENSSTSRFMGSMVILLFTVYFSEFLGFGVILGALAAGLVTRQTLLKEVAIPNWKEHDISRSIHIIAFGFFIPLFFVWIGLNTNVFLILENYSFVLMLSLIALTGVIGGSIIAVKLNKWTLREGLVLGLGLSPKGDIGFVVGAIALEYGIITQNLFSSIVAMSLLITIFSPILFERLILTQKKILAN